MHMISASRCTEAGSLKGLPGLSIMSHVIAQNVQPTKDAAPQICMCFNGTCCGASQPIPLTLLEGFSYEPVAMLRVSCICRGPILEVIVSRMRYIAAQMDRPVRFLGLSTALANAADLADWLAISKRVREIQIRTFEICTFGTRLQVWNKILKSRSGWLAIAADLPDWLAISKRVRSLAPGFMFVSRSDMSAHVKLPGRMLQTWHTWLAVGKRMCWLCVGSCLILQGLSVPSCCRVG